MKQFDITVIGAGVVGAAVARRLSGVGRSVALLEAKSDIGAVTSKANTALLHTGFDAVPGTLEAQLVRTGYELLKSYAQQRGIALARTGAVLVAWTPEEYAALPALGEKAVANGYLNARPRTVAQLRRNLPALGPGAIAGLAIPDEATIDPWSVTLAFVEDALRRGAEFFPETHVREANRDEAGFLLQTNQGPLSTRYLINAAGLGAQKVDAQLGYHRLSVTPRRGELIVFDKLSAPLVPQIVLPVPTDRGKGVLITPTVFGNVMVGPTAEDVQDPTNTATTRNGLRMLMEVAKSRVPQLADHEVTTTYAGIRAAHKDHDYLINIDDGYVLLGGIRSTGLSASLAIGEYVAELLADAGFEVSDAFLRQRKVPPLGVNQKRPYQDVERISADPAYGKLVCFCERVSLGEIRDALQSAIPPADQEALSRRTRAKLGRCQGFACAAQLGQLWATPRELPPMPSQPSVQVAAAPDVLIVGAGPAGLALAGELSRDYHVVVVERESEPGGIPRHCHHSGFGLRSGQWPSSGPVYAKKLVSQARNAGASIMTDTQAVELMPESVQLTSPSGSFEVSPRAVVVATGAREASRSARLIPGDRGAGVMTTGQLQQEVYLHGRRFDGAQAVVLGSGLIAWSAVLTLRQAGARVNAVVSPVGWEAPFWVTWWGRTKVRAVYEETELAEIVGKPRVAAVKLRAPTGEQVVDADLVIMTGDWRAESELLVSSSTSAHSRLIPAVGHLGHTPAPGRFVVGNVAHPGLAAEVVVRHARAAKEGVRDWLETAVVTERHLLLAGAGVFWVYPSLVSLVTAQRVQVLSDRAHTRGTVVVTHGETPIYTRSVGAIRLGQVVRVWMPHLAEVGEQLAVHIV
jgi:L-2-hydroxyglutarate oxidase LhgO